MKRKTHIEDETRRTTKVQSVERAMTLLEALGEDEEGYRLSDLAARVELSPSTVHRLLTTMQQHRFVQFDRTQSTWHVGRQVFSVGSTFVRRRNFVAPALPYLRQLRDKSRETANLAVVDGGEMVVLTQVESREIMRAITRVGGRAPMVSSGMGKAILSTYNPDDVNSVIAQYGMPRMTPHSIVRASQLHAELKLTRQRGYAIDDEEFVKSLRCVAAVVYNHQSEALCAISISGLLERMKDDRLLTLGKLVASTARELTLALGGCPPPDRS